MELTGPDTWQAAVPCFNAVDRLKEAVTFSVTLTYLTISLIVTADGNTLGSPPAASLLSYHQTEHLHMTWPHPACQHTWKLCWNAPHLRLLWGMMQMVGSQFTVTAVAVTDLMRD